MYAMKGRHRKVRQTAIVLREHRLFVERCEFKETAESLRLMMLRDQFGELAALMKRHPEAVRIVGDLLEDRHVGVAPNAADALKEAALAGVDVSVAENKLINALDEPYAKKNAAMALAIIYVKRGDVSSLEGLLKHSDKAVRESAGSACLEGADTSVKA